MESYCFIKFESCTSCAGRPKCHLGSEEGFLTAVRLQCRTIALSGVERIQCCPWSTGAPIVRTHGNPIGSRSTIHVQPTIVGVVLWVCCSALDQVILVAILLSETGHSDHRVGVHHAYCVYQVVPGTCRGVSKKRHGFFGVHGELERSELKSNEMHEMNELTWINWQEWLETHELKRMNWHEWIEMYELRCMNWHEWIETNELKRMTWHEWFVDLILKKWSEPVSPVHILSITSSRIDSRRAPETETLQRRPRTATLPEKKHRVLRPRLFPAVNSRVPDRSHFATILDDMIDMMMWLTWWCDSWRWESFVIRKFPN